MGALGLGGEKPLRKIKALSGGEKARVALSMFALKASNLLMLVSVILYCLNDLFTFAWHHKTSSQLYRHFYCIHLG